MERDGAVEDRFAGDACRLYGGAEARPLGGVQLMASDAWQDDRVHVRLVTGRHRPEHVIGVEYIDIVIHEDDCF